MVKSHHIKELFFKSISAVVFSLFSYSGFAGEDIPQTALFIGADGELIANEERTIEENLLYNPSSLAYQHQLHKIKNFVYFKVEEGTGKYIQADFTATLVFELYYTNLAGQENSEEITLTVDYKKNGGTIYERLKYFAFEGAKRMRVVITSISGNVGWDYKEFLTLKMEMVAVRDYVFNCSNTPSSLAHTALPEIEDRPTGTAPDELRITWATATGEFPTGYEIEWAWIDSYAEDLYKNGSNWDIERIYHNNATRVTVSIDSSVYRIPLLYDDEGTLFYRIRYLQQRENGQLLIGAWTPDEANYSFTGHHPELNWQATIAYAEGGKRKAVVQYFDGSLRGRQTVTKSSTDGYTVVAETIYDFQGRPAIQVLPAPTLSNLIAYTRNFNTIVTGTAVSPVDFDELNINSGDLVCSKQTAAFNTESGAARYYSSANPEKDDGYNQFIPDAGGYVYAETRYSSDGTGRIAEQGGVGAQHQVGASGSTKYYYGSADQKELEALFGTDVGNASHYFKNMVRDANGQYSVSYTDMKGRTVATALAGSAPANLQELEGVSSRSMTLNLLDINSNVIKGNVIESVKSINVPEGGSYQFNYSLGALALELENCEEQNICYECMYDLEITIASDCVTPGASTGQPIVRTYKNLQMTDPSHNHNCSSLHPFSVSFSETLAEGSYTITKRLIISEDSRQYYKQVFLDNNTCKTLQEFTDYYINLFTSQAGNCNPTCEECTTNLGTYSSFKAAFLDGTNLSSQEIADLEHEIQAAYDQAKAFCNSICITNENASRLATIAQSMREDMRPGSGQYALYDEASKIRRYNIFNPAICNGQRFRHPLNDDFTPGFYKDEYGGRDPVNDVLTTISEEEFATRFRDSWIDQLLPYHPEFKKLKTADPALVASYLFDVELSATETWAEAVTKYGLDPLASDPFFNGPGSSFKSAMELYIEVTDDGLGKTYITGQPARALNLWEKAYMMVMCTGDGGINTSCFNNIPTMPPSSINDCTEDWNAIWRMFVTLYQGRKDKFLYDYVSPAFWIETCQTFSTFYQATPSDEKLWEHGYFPHFTSLEGIQDGHPDMPPLNDDTQLSNFLEAQIADDYEAQCESYKLAWIARLMECPAIANMEPSEQESFFETVMDRLKTICVEYTDEDHPFGSSSAPNGSPSFEEVLIEELGNANIEIDNLCHPFMIDFPPPYDQYPAISSELVFTTDDNCFCDRLGDVETERAGTMPAMTLLAFIEYKFGTQMSQTHLDSLVALCDRQYDDCRFLPKPLYIPPALQCGVSEEICKSCDDIAALTEEYVGIAGLEVYQEPANETEVAYNVRYEKFMNYRTGFNKKWTEYLAFLNSCGQEPELNCDELRKLLNEYYATYGNSGYGPDCRQSFVNFFNSETGLFLTFSEIMNLYQQECGFLPDVCEIKINCKKFLDVITQFYNEYGNSVADGTQDCEDLFVDFFNNFFATPLSLTWSEISAAYLQSCGKPLDVCSKYPSTVLQDVKDEFLGGASNRWLIDSCQALFVAFFNQETQSSLEFDDIQLLYNKWQISLDICTPPVSCVQLGTLIDSLRNESPAITDCDSVSQAVNSYFGLSLTSLEFMKLYSLVCGDINRPCGDQQQPEVDCELLTIIAGDFKADSTDPCAEFVDYFNDELHSSLTENEIKALYLQYCGIIPAVCNGGTPPISCAQLETVQNAFFTAFNGSAALLDTSCQTTFRQYFNFSLGVNFASFQAIENLYIACESPLEVCSGVLSNCDRLQAFLDDFHERYDSLSLPRAACRDLFVALYNRKYAPMNYMFWNDIQAAYGTCSITLDICPAGTVTEDSLTMLALARAYQDGASANGSINGCEQRFASFYNQYMGTTYTWSQLMAQYMTVADTIPLVCDNAIGNTVVLRTFVPSAVTGPKLLCGLNEALFPVVEIESPDPCAYIQDLALAEAEEQYEIYVNNLREEFDRKYYEKCTGAQSLESFTVTATHIKEYHYTLYYYDQAGNLVRTVPPAGVDLSKFSDLEEWSDIVATAREEGEVERPGHVLPTDYRYNTLNQVTMQHSPDGGLSKFWYDRLGRLVVSQNAKQAVNDEYSYTSYDALGRIIEVGQLTSSTAMTQAIAKDVEDLADWLTNAAASREQMTKTVYDVAVTTPDLCTPPELLCQRNLRNRVSYSYVQPSASYSNNSLNYTSATYYSYDIHGNVDELVQHYNAGIMQTTGNAYKKITYDYDLISGKVNQVSYQPGEHDQFHHRYEYDAENRITRVHTSGDGVIWETDARYYYYRHGPLARTETGDLLVQGTDYAYTLQGWLKGVNSSALNPTHDMGEDGSSTSIVARDVYGFALHYYNTDYTQVKTTKTVFAPVNTTVLTGFKPLFNGNIAAMAVNIGQFNRPLIYNYGYDQLNRLVAMDAYTGLNSSTNTWTPVHTSDYRERISYDGNGNILTYRRFGTTLNGNSLPMDSLDYQYAYDGSGRLLNNQLEYVDDHVNSAYTTDIDDQSTGNYTYDAIGNLVTDDQEGITGITWNVYGKISSISKSGPVTITYDYDASGNRIGKTVNGKHTWYVRDASGNVMAVYEDENSSINNNALSQIEVHLYGSARLGMWQANRNVASPPQPIETALTGLVEGGVTIGRERGRKIFELSNHLGNVLVTVSDRRVEHNTSGTTIDYYEAYVVSASDYYPGGMEMPGRKYNANGADYRYSINGQEKTPEIAPNTTTAEFWQYDARIVRRWNVDPVQKVYESPYLAFAGNPVWFKDPLGNDTTRYYSNDGELLLTIGNGKEGYNRAMVVKDDKVQAVKDYAAKYSHILNSGPILNNQEVDNDFMRLNYGDVYDLKSIINFYETYKKTYNIQKLRGVSVDQLTSIKIDGKPVSKEYLKSLKGAEATAVVKKVNGIFTVDFNSVSSDNDAFQSTRPSVNDMSNNTHVHLHPFWDMNFEFTYIWEGEPKWKYEPAKGVRDGAITGDVRQNTKDGRTRGLPRTIVVSEKSIRLITGTLSETIYIER